MAKPLRIVVHTTADLYPYAQLERINEWHRQIDFPQSSLGYYVGYTYLIERDGKVIQTRTDTEQQAHVKGYNSDSIGIGVCGNHDYERPTAAQLLSIKNLILEKMTLYSIMPNNIFGHRAFTNAKTCPGLKWPELEIKQLFQPTASYYQSLLDSIRQWLTTIKVKGGGLGSQSPCIDKSTKE